MPEPTEIRADLFGAVRADLHGPGAGRDEVILDNRVRDRYMVGMLAPEGMVALDPARDDDENPDVDLSAAEADEADDPGTGKVSLFPSSLGLSFAVEPDVTELNVAAAMDRATREGSGRQTTTGRRPRVQG